ncbi:MAG: hypothetical protein ACRC8T_08680 [Acidaminococcaceae bacterium]
MKKVILIFITLFFVITNNVAANAIVKIDELDMNILMPSDYTVLTRNTQDGSEVYLVAVDSNKTHEVNITTDKSSDKLAKTIHDLNLFEKVQIENKLPELLEVLRQAGKTPLNNYVYTINKAKYVVVDYRQKDEKGNNLYTRNYKTVKNGKLIAISFTRLDGKELDKEDAETSKRIVDSIVFEEKSSKGEQSSMGRTLLILGAVLLAVICIFVIFVKRLNQAGIK